MFICAVENYRPDINGRKYFDGKLGCWPLTEIVQARLNSKNRGKGDNVEQPIESIDTSVMMDVLINKLLPTICEKFPRDTKSILIQMDNAPSHIDGTEREWIEDVQKTGLPIEISRHPECSPDINVLDLGYFNSIQSLQHKTRSYTIQQLIYNVIKSFQDLEVTTLSNIFVTWKIIMLKIIQTEGYNTYKMPHKRRYHLEKSGIVTTTVVVNNSIMDLILKYPQRNQVKITNYFEHRLTRGRSVRTVSV